MWIARHIVGVPINEVFIVNDEYDIYLFLFGR